MINYAYIQLNTIDPQKILLWSHSFDKYLLSAFSVASAVVSPDDSVENKSMSLPSWK